MNRIICCEKKYIIYMADKDIERLVDRQNLDRQIDVLYSIYG